MPMTSSMRGCMNSVVWSTWPCGISSSLSMRWRRNVWRLGLNPVKGGFKCPYAGLGTLPAGADHVEIAVAAEGQHGGGCERAEHRRRDDAAVLDRQRVEVEDDLGLGGNADRA